MSEKKNQPHHITNLKQNWAKINNGEERLWILYYDKGGMRWLEQGKYYWMVRERRIDMSRNRINAKKGREQNLKQK